MIGTVLQAFGGFILAAMAYAWAKGLSGRIDALEARARLEDERAAAMARPADGEAIN